MSYSIDEHLESQLAAYVDLLLKGAKPEELPVQEPSKFKLIINRRTAMALGLSVPPSLLIRADEVIECIHMSLTAARESTVGTSRQ